MRPRDPVQIHTGSGRIGQQRLPHNVYPIRGRNHAMPSQALVTADRWSATTTTSTSTTIRRVPRPGASEERSTMYASQLGMTHIHAEHRRRELMAEVEQVRRLQQAEQGVERPVPAVIAAARRTIGAALVRVGQRVQGAAAAQPLDAYPSAPTLRLVR